MKVIAFPICKWELLPFPIYLYIIFLNYDVSLHILVVLIVTIPTSPSLSKTEFVGERYCNSISENSFKTEFEKEKKRGGSQPARPG